MALLSQEDDSWEISPADLRTSTKRQPGTSDDFLTPLDSSHMSITQKLFREGRQNMEVDWANHLSIIFQQMIRFVTASIARGDGQHEPQVTALWLAVMPC